MVEKKQRKVNPFFIRLAEVRKNNPNIKDQKVLIKMAKEGYVPLTKGEIKC